MRDIKKLNESAASYKIQRREFIQLAISAGISVASAKAMFAKAHAASPKRGGSARFGVRLGAPTDTLEPGVALGTNAIFWGSMSNALTELDWQGNISGDLAESIESDNGAKRWVFKLRRGVTFHNGKSLRPEDIVASFRHHMGPESKSAAKALLQPIEDIKIDGPDTVVFTLSSGNADFPYICNDWHIPIMAAKADGTADWQDSAGRTGPFTFEYWQPGVQLKLKRNPNYHKSGKPYFDEVTYFTINDVGARTNALLTDKIDWMHQCDLKTLGQLRRVSKVAVVEYASHTHYTLPMMVDRPPFDNNDIRLALKHAINREEICKLVLAGQALPGNDNPVAPTMKYAVNPQPRHSYDLDKVKFYLKRAGVTTLKLDLHTSEEVWPGALDACVLFQQHAKAGGIDINVVREPDQGYFQNVWRKKSWTANFWNGRPTVDILLTQCYAKNSPYNDTHYADPKFNELLVLGRSETDEKKRTAIYTEAQQLLHDNGGAIVVAFPNRVDARSAKLAHGNISPYWQDDGFKIAERWWFA